MRRICVFTGSNKGARPQYELAALSLGEEMAARGLELVYGGASVGLMGVVADAILGAGGEATGVLPRGLFTREVAHSRLTRLYEVGSMHERKALMADLADGFIALPGGLGTFDELFEILTWAQIGIHQKPVGVLNVAGYFTPLQALIEHAVQEKFILPAHARRLFSKETATELLDAFVTFVPPPRESKWTDVPPER
jgi:uncharacterized protein (TIGR00730 family)